jgi:hypothetical protein
LTKQFIIKKVCDEPDKPPYSYKVDEYFEEFVRENIIEPFNIIREDDWKILLSVMMFKKDEESPEGVSIYPAETIEEEKIRYYPIAINIEDVYANNTPMENIVGIYYQIISLFFISNCEGISEEFMLELKKKLDWDYLLSLPYPVPIDEQKYVGD